MCLLRPPQPGREQALGSRAGSSKQQCGDATVACLASPASKRARTGRGAIALFSRPLGPRYCNATPGPVTAGCCLRTERSSDPGRTTGGSRERVMRSRVALYSSRPALACIIGARRAWTVETICSEEIPCRQVPVVERCECPSWRWISGSACPHAAARQREHGGAGAELGAGGRRPRARCDVAPGGRRWPTRRVRAWVRRSRRTMGRQAALCAQPAMAATPPYAELGISHTIPTQWLCRLHRACRVCGAFRWRRCRHNRACWWAL